ncbi:hypothetical protein B0H14DRAFT_2558038 [Mycena olivaceomarginata]|nr:hypothetical protein B0H14DRAFT_2558038 [Mycena olivaceomarginata]
MSDAVDAHAPYNKDEKDNEGEIDTFPEAFENIVRIAHDARQWVTCAEGGSAVKTIDGCRWRGLTLDGAPLLMADVGRDEQIKGAMKCVLGTGQTKIRVFVYTVRNLTLARAGKRRAAEHFSPETICA